MLRLFVFTKKNRKAEVGALAARPLSQRGFTIIEVMAAMTMISVSSVGLLWSVNAVKHNSSRIGLVNSVTTLESAVAGAIMDKTNYGGTVAATLRDGGLPQISLAIAPQADMSKPPVASAIRSGEITNYSPALETCANYGTSECPIRIKVELRRVTVGTRAHYAFAYRIQTKDPEVSFNYAGGGSSGDFDAAFDASEFKLVVPYDFYLQDMLIACSQGESMAMTGVDAATGKPICIKQAEEADKCPDGRMPKSLKVVLDAEGNRKIVLDCGVEAKEAECPANYFLQQIDTTTLDGAYRDGKNGRCVYAGAHSATTSVPYSAKRIAGQVCPPGYRSRSRCVIDQNTIVSSAGSCPWCWGSALDCGSSTVSENPVGSGNFRRTTNYFCSDTSPRPMPANEGRPVLKQNAADGLPEGYADCSLQHAQQDCGATWDAMVHLDVVCEMYDGGQPAETTSVR